MVLRWNLQVHGRIRPVRELGVVRVPRALAHRHVAAGGALPAWVFHTNERCVVRRLVFTGRGGRWGGPGAGGAGRREAVGSAGVQAGYSHHLGGMYWRFKSERGDSSISDGGRKVQSNTWCCIRCSGKAVRGCGSSSWLLCLRRHSKLKDGLLLPDRIESAQVSVFSEASLKINHAS